MTLEGLRNDQEAGGSKRLISRRTARLPTPLRVLCRSLLMVSVVLLDTSGIRAFGATPGDAALDPFDEGTSSYSKAKDTSPIARLQERIDRAEVKLRHDAQFGYLLSLLEELGVSSHSQLLVFSKTSLQRERITPKTPRALYFNDEVYLGFIPGAPFIEVSGMDSKLGGVFYSIDQGKTGRPRFVRTDQCLECHTSTKTLGVPGPLVRSFVTDADGVVDMASGTSLVNHRTPLSERWGGWYVTGTHGAQTHRGNLSGREAFARHEKEPNYLGNQIDLKRFFDVSRYPAAASDIVALMTLEHQAHMQNFLTRLNQDSTAALRQFGHLNHMKSEIEGFLKYLLFTEEAPLSAPIHGSAAFVGQFTAMGIKDTKGRSLRQFDLERRLFKYPCSYLIYSDAFDALPEQLKETLYRRLWDILTSKDTGPAFAGIPSETKQAIREILTETKKDVPPYWK
ncbi:MAG: hypothetical protein JNN07_11575 [Verrucomicrobiales bacterium]|nr:hypothetical protein [Verrucomicrobiales bacterium]